jgi:multimeric flavodoxin WrbA
MSVTPCRVCDTCKELNGGVLRDDTDLVYSKSAAADVLVFATPIYYYAASAWLKAVVHGTYAFLDSDYSPRVAARKKLFLITTQEEPHRAYGEAVASALARSFKWLGMELAGSLVATEVSRPMHHQER